MAVLGLLVGAEVFVPLQREVGGAGEGKRKREQDLNERDISSPSESWHVRGLLPRLHWLATPWAAWRAWLPLLLQHSQVSILRLPAY